MQNTKFLRWLIAVALFPMALGVHAAGLGRLNVTSALGEPLRGEIELVAVKKDEIPGLQAKMASFDQFKQAGLDYTGLLAGVRLALETKPDGQPFIRVTSTQPINEPYIALLVELTSTNGRILREYTFLLDPPGFDPQKPVVAAAPKAAPAPAAPAAPVAVPVPVEPRPVPAPRAAAAPAAAGAGTYGPVKRGETLSRIAGATKPEGVSLEQMLIALQRANRDAFVGDNVNRLKTGPVLRVPDRAEAQAIQQPEAIREVRVQASDWNSYRRSLGAAAGSQAPAEAPKQAVSGKISTAVEDKAAAKEQPKEVLKISKGEPPAGAAAAGGKESRALQDRVRTLEEEATARAKALKEANERVALLEKNIKEMQRLLEVKSQGLADAQKQAAAAAAKPAETKPVEAPKPAAPAPVPAPAKPEPAKPEPAKPEPAKPEPAKPEPAKPEAAKPEPAKPEAAKPEAAQPEPVKAAEPAKPADEAKPAAPVEPKPAPKPKAAPPPPPPEKSFLDEILENPIYLAVIAGSVILLGVVAFMALRRKKPKPAKGGGDGGLGALGTAGVAAAGAGAVAAATMGGEEEQLPKSAVQADEVDPVAEADVYLTYGRDAQAEEILRDALAKDPGRQDVLVKMLEIYASRNDSAAFEATARKLQSAGAGQTIWNRAVNLGASIDPSNPLYQGGQAVGVGGAAAGSAPDIALDAGGFQEPAKLDLDFDLDLTAPAGAGEGGKAAPEHMDFDITAIDEELPRSDDETVFQPPPPTETITLDDALVFDIGAPDATLTPERAAPPPEDEGLAFMAEAPERTVVLEVPEHEKTIMLEPQDLHEKTLVLEPRGAHEKTLVLDSTALETMPPSGAGLPSIDTIDLGGPVGGGGGEGKDAHWHDVATKFDLAKAYQEMGDREGAREILEEVLREGDEEQQAQARFLLESLA